MKNVFRNILLLSFFIISCNADDDLNTPLNYPYLNQVGFSANDILSKDTFSDIYIEVLFIYGYSPTNDALNNFKKFIEARTYKSDITIETRLIEIPFESSYTLDAIKIIEDNNRSQFSLDNQISIFVLFLNGTSSKNTENEIILGTSYRNTSFVIFEETIRSLSGSAPEPSRMLLESTVLLHEFSHLLGLVDVGTPMIANHQDTENDAHCIMTDCLMFHEIENVNTKVNFINEEQIPQLDIFCLEDLKANGGK